MVSPLLNWATARLGICWHICALQLFESVYADSRIKYGV